MQQLVPDFSNFFWTDAGYVAKHNEKALPPRSAGEENEVLDNSTSLEEGSSQDLKVKIGVFLEPEEHMRTAFLLHHPMDTTLILPDLLKRAVFKMMTVEPHLLAKERLDMLKYYRSRAEVLHMQEEALHQSLPQHVQEVVKGKRLLLLEERLNATGFPDMQVMEDFRNGVDLVGEEPFSHLYMERLQPASMSVEQLELSAALSRNLTMARPPTDQEREHADRLIELSQEEVEERFLCGPFFTEEEVTKHLGTSDWTLTKRFLLQQGEDLKERVIDDYKRSMVNAAFAPRSYLELQDVDILAALVTYIMRLASEGPTVTVQLQDGTLLQGRKASSVSSGEALMGRCFDLSKAYKQIAVSQASLKHAVLGARDSSGRWYMYTSQSLPFGAIPSIYAFNKSARALQHLMLVDFSVVMTNYFDDYPTLEWETAGSITTGLVSQFFQLLGWRHAVAGKKAKPF